MNKPVEPAEDQPPPKERRYHHGDLRAALMDAGEAELARHGIEGFSLRNVARRAGVSHAAPAHHFRDAKGLLTALATRGFQRFVARQRDFQRQAAPAPRAQMQACGVGYVAFALENPAVFRLMFGSDRTDFDDPNLKSAAEAAFLALVDGVAQVTAAGNQTSPAASPLQAVGSADVAAAWALAHGLADLMVAGRLPWLSALPTEERNRAIASILTRSLP